jgi:hypothetical protein
LKSLVPLQAFAVLIIDEAQNLSLPLLEEIRILSDLEAPEKLLQVVLVGQLELQNNLKLPEMRQLDQRVSSRCSLPALTREAAAGYISHRLSVAGGDDDRVHFSPNAVDAVFRASAGIPRVVNLICDRALHRGHLARKHVIDLEAVSQAIEDLGVGTLTPAPAKLAPPIVPAVAATTAAAADLSGLEVHVLEETPAPSLSILATPRDRRRPVMWQTSPRRWRRRAIRGAGIVGLIAAILFFALLGQAVFLNYFPAAAQVELRLPARPRGPALPNVAVPVDLPADVTLPPASMPLDSPTGPFAMPPAASEPDLPR